MKRKDYEKPTTQVVKLKQQCIICASPDKANVQDYNWHNVDEE